MKRIIELLFIVLTAFVAAGCSTEYRKKASGVFQRPKDPIGWVLYPIAGAGVILSWPVFDSIGMLDDMTDGMTDEQKQQLVDHSFSQVPGASGGFSSSVRPSVVYSQQKETESSSTSDSGNAERAATDDRSEMPLSAYEQVLMSRIKSKVENEVSARRHFHGFCHNVNFWTTPFRLINGNASFDLNIVLPKSDKIELFFASTEPYNPISSQTSIISDDGSCLFRSINVLTSSDAWRGGSDRCGGAAGINLRDGSDTASREITLHIILTGLESSQGQVAVDAFNTKSFPYRDGAIAVFALEK